MISTLTSKPQPFCSGVGISLDGTEIIMTDTAGRSNALHVYCAKTGAFLRAVPGFSLAMQLYVAPDDGFVYVAEYGANRVRKLTPELVDAAAAPFAPMYRPMGVCADRDAVVVCGDGGHARKGARSDASADSLSVKTSSSVIAVFSRLTGTLLYVFELKPHALSGALALHPSGAIAVAGGDTRVALFSFSGKHVGSATPAGALASRTYGIAALANAGVLLVADGAHSVIHVFNAEGHCIKSVPTLRRVHNVAVNEAHGIVVTQNFDDNELAILPLANFFL